MAIFHYQDTNTCITAQADVPNTAPLYAGLLKALIPNSGPNRLLFANGVTGASDWIELGRTKLSEMTDVVINNPTNGQVLTYSSSTGKWYAATPSNGGGGGGGGVSKFDDLTDINWGAFAEHPLPDLTGTTDVYPSYYDGYVLQWNRYGGPTNIDGYNVGGWELGCLDLSKIGGVNRFISPTTYSYLRFDGSAWDAAHISIADCEDYQNNGLSDGYVLTYSQSLNKWVPSAPGGGSGGGFTISSSSNNNYYQLASSSNGSNVIGFTAQSFLVTGDSASSVASGVEPGAYNSITIAPGTDSKARANNSILIGNNSSIPDVAPAGSSIVGSSNNINLLGGSTCGSIFGFGANNYLYPYVFNNQDVGVFGNNNRAIGGYAIGNNNFASPQGLALGFFADCEAHSGVAALGLNGVNKLIAHWYASASGNSPKDVSFGPSSLAGSFYGDVYKNKLGSASNFTKDYYITGRFIAKCNTQSADDWAIWDVDVYFRCKGSQGNRTLARNVVTAVANSGSNGSDTWTLTFSISGGILQCTFTPTGASNSSSYSIIGNTEIISM